MHPRPYSDHVDYSVLGPLRVEGSRGPVEIRGAKERLLLARLVAAGIRVAELMPERRTLEQVVLELTGHGADRMDADPVNADRAPGAQPRS